MATPDPAALSALASHDSPKLTHELWREVEPLLAEALDMEPSARTEWLAGVIATNPSIGPVLRRLLETHDRAVRSGQMETIPKLAPAPGVHAPDEAVGPYRLIRLLGRGGMGEVWLARQADGGVERNVALKLPGLAQAGDAGGERFRRERDILARLEHPNIARLYDAGVTPSGQPWLAMEFVDGLSLSEYVASRALPLPARLSLFRQVLAAVAHAHRYLVVHRDLKPANIIIDRVGQVRLLDFGIAKLMADADAPEVVDELTRAGARLMTLRYAAPEQVAGGAITTATDIYSLGVILHELVTGVSPYRAVREGRPLAEAMLLQEETAVPSRLALPEASAHGCGLGSARQLARRLAGDLDAIVLKAMRREPAERYASAERFAEDIGAHLERRPVRARAGTWRYLAGRFAWRHKLPLAAASAVMVALALGFVAAEFERRAAVAERARAEKHFASVRRLANAFIFDVHGEIETLPGSLKAREMLVRTSLEYLDALVGESAGDVALMAELAAAYRKIGNIQGQPGGANTGHLSLALANFEKAKRLHLEIERVKPPDIATLREHTSLSYALARAWFLQADPRWQAEIAQTIALAGRVAALPGATPRDRARVASALAEQAHLVSIAYGQGPQVEADVARALALLEALARELPGDVGVARNLMSTHQRAAVILTGDRWTPDTARRAAGHHREALAILEDLLAKGSDVQVLKLRLENTVGLANAQLLAGDVGEADRTIALALARAAELAGDAGNIETASDRLGALVQAALIAHRAGDAPRAIRHGREALAIVAGLPADTRGTRDVRSHVSEAQAYLGFALMAAADQGRPDHARRRALLGEARGLLAAAVAFVAEARQAKLGAVPERDAREIEDALARCEAELARLGG